MTFATAFTPDPVEKLTATADTHKPSVTLKWDPPANAGYPGYITKYQVRFWNKEKGCYIESTVDGSTTTTVITRESGLRPLTVTTFEVRACSGRDACPEWRTESAFIGKCDSNVEHFLHEDGLKDITYLCKWFKKLHSCCSLIPRPSYHPVFDCLLYAKMERGEPGPFYHMNDLSGYLGGQRGAGVPG